MAWQALVKKIAEKVIKDKIKAKVGEEVMSSGGEGSGTTGVRAKVAGAMQNAQKLKSIARLFGLGGDKTEGGVVDTKPGISTGDTAEGSVPTIEDAIKQNEYNPSFLDKVGGAISAKKSGNKLGVISSLLVGDTEKRDEANKVHSYLQGAASLADNIEDPDFKKNITAMMFEKKPNGEYKAIKQTPETAAAIYGMATQASTVQQKISDFAIAQEAKKQRVLNAVDLEKKSAMDVMELEQLEQKGIVDARGQVLKDRMTLSATEQAGVIAANQGQNWIKESEGLLTDENFVTAVLGNTGKVGQLATWGNTEVRNYNNSVTGMVTNIIKAQSGTAASDPERESYGRIFGIQAGDTMENITFKRKMANSFFQTAKDVFDPEQVSEKSTLEINGRINELEDQFKQLGKGDSKVAKKLIDALKEKNNSSKVNLKDLFA